MEGWHCFIDTLKVLLFCGHIGCVTDLLTHGQRALLCGYMDSWNCSIEIWTMETVIWTHGQWTLFCGHMDWGHCSLDTWTVDTLCEHMDSGTVLSINGQWTLSVDIWTVALLIGYTDSWHMDCMCVFIICTERNGHLLSMENKMHTGHILCPLFSVHTTHG